MHDQLKLHENYNVTIKDMAHDGAGVGKLDGFTIFVDEAVIGDKVNIEITKLKKNYGIGKVVCFIKHSPHKVNPRCSIFAQCGGCQIQNIRYEKQLKLKKKVVEDNLERIGGLKDIFVHDVIGMQNPERYRNKVQLPVRKRNGKIEIGFYQKKSHNIIDSTSCFIQHEVNDKIIKVMKDIITKHQISVYDEKTGRGLLRHIVTKIGFNTQELMLILVTNGDKMPNKELIIKDILKQLPEITEIVQNINTKKTNVILGRQNRTLYGKGYITDTIEDIKFNISPLSFYQVNPIQMEKLYHKALEYAQLSGKETVFDLYCGIGTISLFLARKAKKVIGVELIKDAVKDAEKNAEINDIKNTEFFTGKTEEVVPNLYQKGYKADIVVVDPPRKGCDEKLLATMIEMHPDRIIYVSCNPSTLARDLKYLDENGYKATEVQPVDMFPHGMHVETVVLLSQQEPDDKISINLDLDELDITSSESKATYEEIKDYTLKKHGLQVSSLYIAQVKEKRGIKERKNYNKAKSKDSRVPQCTLEKEKAITDALKHFQMI